ncbi:hypothetical protein OVA24_13225 [Luteolibacter sp. SL250]|uniref:hypothetical protein n=1 Tax=Luteolibacter sp. SL250 TaxID=2995170 RepID=UPI00226E947D|nr:hypothetical protein [Luteolibacter sp. SL250]WAC18199.1 hypothetical protein OVA24_13225 [Luteolibacter sp. SL250]
MSFDYEDLANPPSTGGKRKMILLGIVLPVLISLFAAKTWISMEAYWPGRRGGMTIYDDAARAMAVLHLSIACFCHSRWFWGLRGEEKIFKVGIVLSMLTGLCAGYTAFILAM